MAGREHKLKALPIETKNLREDDAMSHAKRNDCFIGVNYIINQQNVLDPITHLDTNHITNCQGRATAAVEY